MPLSEERIKEIYKDLFKGGGGQLQDIGGPFVGGPTRELETRARFAERDIREVSTLMKAFGEEVPEPEQAQPGFLSKLFHTLALPGNLLRGGVIGEKSFVPTMQRVLGGGGDIEPFALPSPFPVPELPSMPGTTATTGRFGGIEVKESLMGKPIGTGVPSRTPLDVIQAFGPKRLGERLGREEGILPRTIQAKVGNIAGGALGLLADIATDPLTYIGLGTPVTGGGRALVSFMPRGIFTGGVAGKGGARALIRGAPVLGAAGRAGEAFGQTAIGRTLGKAFVPGFGLPSGYRLLDQTTRRELIHSKMLLDDATDAMFSGLTQSELNYAALAVEHPALLSLRREGDRLIISAEAGEIIGKTGEKASKLLGTKIDLHDIDIEKVRSAVADFSIVRDSYLKRILDAGLLEEEDIIKNYIPHILSKGEPSGMFRGTRLPRFRGLGGRVQIQQEFFQKGRKFDDLIDAAEAGFIPETDIATISRKLGRSVETTLAKRSFLDRTMEMFGTKVTAANVDEFAEGLAAGTHRIFFPKGMVRFYPDLKVPKSVLDQPGNIIQLTRDQVRAGVGVTTKVPAFVIPREIFDDLMRVDKTFGSDEAMNAFLKFFDTAQTYWKGRVTVTTPGFHIRNAYSNSFNSWLAGMNDPRRFKQAADVVRHTPGNIAGKSHDEIFDLASELGVYKPEGAFIGEITRVNPLTEGSASAGQLMNPFSSRFAPVEAGRAGGSAIENNARVALFIDRLGKGDTPVDAANVVKKYLFDYGELTAFERGVMRRAIPFYTWLRKNTAVQAEHLFTTPGKFSAVGRLLKGGYQEQEEALPLAQRPRFLRRGTSVALESVTIGGLPTIVSVDLPISELELEQFSGGTARGLSPFIQAASKVISMIKGEEKARVPVPAIAAKIVDSLPEPLRQAAGIKEIKSFITGRPVPGMDPRVKSLLLTVFPLMAKISRVLPTEEQLSDPKFLGSVTAMATGVRVQPVDVRRQLAITKLQRRRQIEQHLNILFRQGDIDARQFGFARRFIRRIR